MSTGVDVSSFDTIKGALRTQCPIWMVKVAGGYSPLTLVPCPEDLVGRSLGDVTLPLLLTRSKYFAEIKFRCESVPISATMGLSILVRHFALKW